MTHAQNSENAQKVIDLSQKLDNAEALNKKLLTEMAQLQQEKRQVESHAADASQKVEALKRAATESEKLANEKVQLKEWHFLGETVSSEAREVKVVKNNRIPQNWCSKKRTQSPNEPSRRSTARHTRSP